MERISVDNVRYRFASSGESWKIRLQASWREKVLTPPSAEGNDVLAGFIVELLPYVYDWVSKFWELTGRGSRRLYIV